MNVATSEAHELLPVANRVLVEQGVLDAYGHVSMRDTEDADYFWISRNKAPQSVNADDLQRIDLDGVPADERRSYLEVFIHSEIYRLRPDVQAVVHSHASVVVPYSIVDEPMQCVSHMAGFLAGGVPRFEIRDAVGDGSDLLITNQQTGRALAEELGDAAVALMRGHGAVIVGGSVQEAVHRSVFTAFNAKILTDAATIGGRVRALSEAEGVAAMRANQGQIARAWDLWSAQVED